MRVAFGFDVRVPQDTGWLQKVRARDFAEMEIADAAPDSAPAFDVLTPKVGEWGRIEPPATLERHVYVRRAGALATGLAVSRVPGGDLPVADYAGAPVVDAPGPPSLRAFEDAACLRDWSKSYPFAWRPFEPSATRRRGDVNLRKSAKGALRDEGHRASRERGLAECRAEAARYHVADGRVWRRAGEPVWAASADAPARVVATCDHAIAGIAGGALLFPADRREEAVSACAAMTGTARHAVVVIGAIESAPGTTPRFRGEVFAALRGLQEFLDGSHHLLACADAGEARRWSSIREAVADHPDPKSSDVFLDPDFAVRIEDAVRDAFGFVAAVRRSGFVDDSRAEKASGALSSMRRRLDLLPGGAAFAARPPEGAFAPADEAALEALA